jgi:hypothetical protein
MASLTNAKIINFVFAPSNQTKGFNRAPKHPDLSQAPVCSQPPAPNRLLAPGAVRGSFVGGLRCAPVDHPGTIKRSYAARQGHEIQLDAKKMIN